MAPPQLFALLVAFASAPIARPSNTHELILKGLDRDFGRSAWLFELGERAAVESGSYWLITQEGTVEGRATVYDDPSNASKLLGVVIDGLPAHRELRLVLRPANDHVRSQGIAVDLDASEPGLTHRVRTSGRSFVDHHETPNKPFLYPVIGPGEKEYTRAYPMRTVDGEARDHPHQRSLWLAHGDVSGVDFWASDPLNGRNPRFGEIKVESCEPPQSGLALGVLSMNLAWNDSDGRPLLREHRTWRFWDLGETRLIDCDSTLIAARDDVTLGDTKEGTFGLRMPTSISVDQRQGGTIVNAEGLRNGDAWGKRSPWVDYHGPLGKAIAGVAILNHPSSFRHPTAWHVREYGLFAANPFGYRDFKVGEPGALTLSAGDAITLRHRVVLHQGDHQSARIADQFAAYSAVPQWSLETK